MTRSAEDVTTETATELEEIAHDFALACDARDLSVLDRRLLVLEASVALLIHYHAQHFGMDEGEEDWTRGQNTIWAMVDDRREALLYALEHLESGTSFDSHMDEWRAQ